MDPISVIINVYNERDTIEVETREIYSQIISRIPGSEFIIAEDGSTDGTKEIIGKLCDEYAIIYSTSEARKGYTRAFKDAVQLTSKPWIFFADTGGKNNFDEFWDLYNQRENYDLVIGRRTGRKDQAYRRFLTWAYNFCLRMYFRVDLRDADSGFRLYKSAFLKKTIGQEWINSELISSELSLRIAYMGGKILEVPVSYRQRKGTSQNLPPWKIIKIIFNVVKNFRYLKSTCHYLKRDCA